MPPPAFDPLQRAPTGEAVLPPVHAGRMLYDHTLIAEVATSPQPVIAAQRGDEFPVVLTRSTIHRLEAGAGGVLLREIQIGSPALRLGRGAVVREADGSAALITVTSLAPGEVQKVNLDRPGERARGYCSFISSMHSVSPAGDAIAFTSMGGLFLNFFAIDRTEGRCRLSAACTFELGGPPGALAFHPATTLACAAAHRAGGEEAQPFVLLVDLAQGRAVDLPLTAAGRSIAFHPVQPALVVGDAAGGCTVFSTAGGRLEPVLRERLGGAPVTAAAAAEAGFYLGTEAGEVWRLSLTTAAGFTAAGTTAAGGQLCTRVAEFPGRPIFDLQLFGTNHLVASFRNGGAVVLREDPPGLALRMPPQQR